MYIDERAKALVCQMNDFEAKRLGLADIPTERWPEWAKRDYRLACEALCEVEAEVLARPKPFRSPIKYL